RARVDAAHSVEQHGRGAFRREDGLQARRAARGARPDLRAAREQRVELRHRHGLRRDGVYPTIENRGQTPVSRIEKSHAGFTQFLYPGNWGLSPVFSCPARNCSTARANEAATETTCSLGQSEIGQRTLSLT